MKSLAATRRRKAILFCLAGMLSLPTTRSMVAQAPTEQPSGATPDAQERSALAKRIAEQEHFLESSVDRFYKLKYAATPQDANEILTAVRNMLDPRTKIFLVPSTGIIAVHAPDDQQAAVKKIIDALDLPHPRYRLTYTLTELDGTRKVGLQHFSMVVVSGQRTVMKQGSRLPILTSGNAGVGNFSYIDIGLNFEVTLEEIQGGGVLKEKVEQTSIAPDSTSATNPNPIFRQTLLEGTTSLAVGKPQLVGSLDVPSSTHHFDVEVVMEPIN